MKEKICSFCGNRIIITKNLESIIEETLINLVERYGYNTFYSGSMGEFDKLCELVVRRLKRKYRNIKLCRIMYYYRHTMDNENNLLMFDEIIIPEIEGMYYKRAIAERNKWMVEQAGIVLCHVHKDYGGAYKMMKYAETIQKNIINL